MPRTKKPASLDAAGRTQARRTIADFAKIAHTFEAWSGRDAESIALAKQLMAGGDPADQNFLLKQLRAAPDGYFAGRLALILVGLKDRHRVTSSDSARTARPEILRGVGALLANAEASIDLWQAATIAIFLTDRAHAAEKLRPFLTPPSRGGWIMQTALYLEPKPSRAILELGLRASELREFQGYDNTVASVVGHLQQPKKEAELAHALELDLKPELIERVFRLVVCKGGTRLIAKERKRILPAVEAVAARLRDDPAARARLQAVDKALELAGGLLSPTPIKVPKAPKAPPRLKLELAAGSDGGPLLALPKEAVAAWRGVLDPKTGKPPPTGDFTGTDYRRACAVSEGPLKSPWGGFGVLKVGGHSGLVLGRSASTARLKDGSVLLVIDEPGEEVEENLAALLKAEPKWQKVKGELALPSGALVIFDSAAEHAKTKNKSTLELPPGAYRIEEHHSDKKGSSLWLFRLSRVG